MRTQSLEQIKVLGLDWPRAFDELIDEAAELRFARLADEGLLESDLVDEDLDIRLGGEMEEGDFLCPSAPLRWEYWR